MTRTVWARIVVALALLGLVLGFVLLATHYDPPAQQPGTTQDSEF